MPAAPQPVSSVSEALNFFGAQYGSIWRDGLQLADVVELSGAVDISRIDMRLVGKSRMGHKPGIEQREGNLRVRKRDTRWEHEVHEFTHKTDDERRAARDAGEPIIRPFSLIVEFDDPYAVGYESAQLDGVLMWRMPVGFSLDDDLVQREFPITWEDETFLNAFRLTQSSSGAPIATYFEGEGPPA